MRRVARSIPKSSQVRKTGIFLFFNVFFPSNELSITVGDLFKVFSELQVR